MSLVISNSGSAGIPPIKWLVHIPKCRAYLKPQPVSLKTSNDYLAWVSTINSQNASQAGVTPCQSNPKDDSDKAQNESLIAKTTMRVTCEESNMTQRELTSALVSDLESGSGDESEIDDQEIQMAKIYEKYMFNVKYD